MGVPPPTGNQIIAFQWSMTIFTLGLVILRTYIRIFKPRVQYHQPRRSWQLYDFLVIFAWLFFLAQSIITTLLNETGFFVPGIPVFDPNGKAKVQALKLYYVSNTLYLFCMYCIKCAMLLFFREFIPKFMKKTWIAWWVAAVLVVVSWIAGTFMLLFWCLPVSRNWSLDDKMYCSSDDQAPVVGFTIACHLLSDIIIYCLPWPVVIALSLPPRQKVGIGITFALGFLCVFFAVALLIAAYCNANFSVMYIFGGFEQTWAVVVACCPAFKEMLVNGDIKKGWSRVSLFMNPNGSPRSGSGRDGSHDGNVIAGIQPAMQENIGVQTIAIRSREGSREGIASSPENKDGTSPAIRVELRHSVEMYIETRDGVKIPVPSTRATSMISMSSRSLRIPITMPRMSVRQFLAERPNMGFIREAKTREETEGQSWAILDDGHSTVYTRDDASFVTRDNASIMTNDFSIVMPIQHDSESIPPVPELPVAYLASPSDTNSSHQSRSAGARSFFKAFSHRRSKSHSSTGSSSNGSGIKGQQRGISRTSWLHCNASVERMDTVQVLENSRVVDLRKESVASSYKTTESWLDPGKASGSSHGSWLDV